MVQTAGTNAPHDGSSLAAPRRRRLLVPQGRPCPSEGARRQTWGEGRPSNEGPGGGSCPAREGGGRCRRSLGQPPSDRARDNGAAGRSASERVLGMGGARGRPRFLMTAIWKPTPTTRASASGNPRSVRRSGARSTTSCSGTLPNCGSATTSSARPRPGVPMKRGAPGRIAACNWTTPVSRFSAERSWLPLSRRA